MNSILLSLNFMIQKHAGKLLPEETKTRKILMIRQLTKDYLNPKLYQRKSMICGRFVAPSGSQGILDYWLPGFDAKSQSRLDELGVRIKASRI